MNRIALFLCAALTAPAMAFNDLESNRAQLDQAAIAYENGDHESAFRAFMELARNGSPTAQYNVSVMYALGHGIEQNAVHAAAWMGVAAHFGDPDAEKLFQNIMFEANDEERTAVLSMRDQLLGPNISHDGKRERRRLSQQQAMEDRFARNRDHSDTRFFQSRATGSGICGSTRSQDMARCYGRRATGLGIRYAQLGRVFQTLNNRGLIATTLREQSVPETEVTLVDFKLVPLEPAPKEDTQ